MTASIQYCERSASLGSLQRARSFHTLRDLGDEAIAPA